MSRVGFSGRSYPLFAPAVGGEVINGHFDAFSLLQLPEDGDEQLEVEGVRVIKVILVFSSQVLFFFIQNLKHKQILCFEEWPLTM